MGLILREIANSDIVTEAQRTAIIRDLAHDTLDERRFSLAIFPHEGDFVSAMNRKRGVRKDEVVAISFREMFRNHGIRARARRRRKAEVEHGRILGVDLDPLHARQLFNA